MSSDERQKKMIIRFAILFGLVFLGFVAVIIKIILLQTVEREQWLKVIEYQVKVNQEVAPVRGNILDTDGNLLATSLPQYVVKMDTRVESLHLKQGAVFYQYLDSMAQGLSYVIGDKSPEEYRKLILKAYRNPDPRKRDIRLHKGRINYIQKKEILKLPLIGQGYYASGVYLEEMHQRSKPFGSLGKRTIGSIYGKDGNGSAGLEFRYNDYLKGKPGIARVQRVAGEKEEVIEKEAVNGYDIQTTLDVHLMDICESALRKRLELQQADWGCCILMETHSGKIRAISNLDRTDDGTYEEMRNHAVNLVEPGSTFKTIALMAAMDDGKVHLYDTVRIYSKGWDYGVAHHTDAHKLDTVLTVRSALAISSNIAFAKIITESYDKKADKFVNKLQRMGICDSVYCEIPGFQNPKILVPKDGVTLSKMAYGYSVELTPMQILMFYNGIANDGKMIRPYLVSRVLNQDEVVESYSTQVVQSSLCSRKALEDIRLALHDVVWDNDLPGTASVRKWQGKITGYKAQSKIVSIAGKTGTAQLYHHGKYQDKEHRMTFVGYFPEDNPQYSCICMIEHPRNNYDAGMDCGTVVREIAEKTMVYAGHNVIRNGKITYEIK